MEAGKRHLAGDTARAATTDEVKDLRLRRALQPPALSREPRQRDTSRRLLWQGRSHHQTARKDQTPDYPTSALAASQDRRLTSTQGRDRLSANPQRILNQMFWRRTARLRRGSVLALRRSRGSFSVSPCGARLILSLGRRRVSCCCAAMSSSGRRKR